MPAIADDSGLMVDALGGEPGVYSARYGGPGLDDTGRWQLLLRNMAGQTNRQGGACQRHLLRFFPTAGILSRERVRRPADRGAGGDLGLATTYLPAPAGKTMAQITPEEKSDLPHRAKALADSR